MQSSRCTVRRSHQPVAPPVPNMLNVPVAEQHVVYNLSTTNISADCTGMPFGAKVPDACCSATGTFNMLGKTFAEFYSEAGNDTCPVLIKEKDAHGMMQCNKDKTVTYGENCNQDCAPCND